MDLYKYYTEDELELIELEQEMQFLPNQQEQYDFMLGKLYASLIKKMVRKRYPKTSISNDDIDELTQELAKCFGYYQISLMSYESLEQAWFEQSYRLLKKGTMGKKEYFALIDARARQIGVHVPKSYRQVKYEKLISAAVAEFNTYLKNFPKKIEPNPEIQSFAVEELWNQKLDKFKKVKIRATKQELYTQTIVMSNNKKLQFSFDKEKGVLYYHIMK